MYYQKSWKAIYYWDTRKLMKCRKCNSSKEKIRQLDSSKSSCQASGDLGTTQLNPQVGLGCSIKDNYPLVGLESTYS